MSKRGTWIAPVGLLGWMFIAACGGGAGSASNPSATTPSPSPPPTEPPAFPGEPDYQAVQIAIVDDNAVGGQGSTGLSEGGARDLLQWSVRFANYEWTFGPEGQTRSQQWMKAYPFATPELREAEGPPPRSDPEAREKRGDRPQYGPQGLGWDPNYLAWQRNPPPFAQFERSKARTQDVKISLWGVQVIRPSKAQAGQVILEARRISGYWRLDSFDVRDAYGSLKAY